MRVTDPRDPECDAPEWPGSSLHAPRARYGDQAKPDSRPTSVGWRGRLSPAAAPFCWRVIGTSCVLLSNVDLSLLRKPPSPVTRGAFAVTVFIFPYHLSPLYQQTSSASCPLDGLHFLV